ncbi:hypothetical protein [Streptomyces radiopugnans]|uniref:hypothetical protein n=1 Tax=Streptomyces radiopugnans TaxID=403935 RepID=UPI003F1DDA51
MPGSRRSAGPGTWRHCGSPESCGTAPPLTAAGGFAEFADLATAWLRRGAAVYPSAMTAPTLTADDLVSLARTLTGD